MIIVELNRCLTPACVAEGKTDHRWEFERPTMREFLRVQECLGLDPDEWEQAMNEAQQRLSAASIKASLMLINILHRRIGIASTYEETDFDLFDLHFLADPEAEVEQEEGGKGSTPTSPLPEDGAPASSTSGPSTKAGSGRRSSPTPVTSGPDSGSP